MFCFLELKASEFSNKEVEYCLKKRVVQNVYRSSTKITKESNYKTTVKSINVMDNVKSHYKPPTNNKIDKHIFKNMKLCHIIR